MGFRLTVCATDPRIISDQPPPVDPQVAAAARAINYAITSSSAGLSQEARDALNGIAHQLGRMLVAPPDSHGAAERWRVIAAVALQMEARAMGLDYTLGMNDNSLTPD